MSLNKDDNKKSKKIKRIVFITGIFLILILLVVVLVREEKKEDFLKKLYNTEWHNSAGDTFVFYSNKTCDAILGINVYKNATIKVSNCTYEIVDNKIIANYEQKITDNGRVAHNTDSQEFIYNDDMTQLELKLTDPEFSNNKNITIFKKYEGGSNE